MFETGSAVIQCKSPPCHHQLHRIRDNWVRISARVIVRILRWFLMYYSKFKTIIKRVIFQNFGWKIRVLSPGENGAPYTRSLHSLLLAFLLTTLTAAEILLWKVNHKCQNKNEALTVNDSFFVIWKNAASKTHGYTVQCWFNLKIFSLWR